MFERRLKIVLIVLFVLTSVLALRAAQLQVLDRGHWAQRAAETLRREQTVETTRGRILDARGVVMAEDVACIDACVDYRALTDPPDEKWLQQTAQRWAREKRAAEFRAATTRAERDAIVAQERLHVLERIRLMWPQLASEAGVGEDVIEDVRRAVILRVEMRRRLVWYRKFQLAQDARADELASHEPSWWKRWLADDTATAPDVDNYKVDVAEQFEAHPILRAISPQSQNRLGKMLDDLPGLSLRPGVTRAYRNGPAICHLIGHLSRVRREDLSADPYGDDDRRKYQYNDLIGRSGLEALCEPLLRGTRGRIERLVGGDAEGVLNTEESLPGADVSSTVDLSLQLDILGYFQNARVQLAEAVPQEGRPGVVHDVSVHGGAVVIDIPTGAVRALVSNPTFDPNRFDLDYKQLAKDRLNQPLISRATQYPLETGSTIKPVVGIGAITDKLIGVNHGIECTGFLVINGRRYSRSGRCWVASKFMDRLGAAGVAHHPIPYHAPHRGHDGNADGFLTFADAIERSCNIYFETIADRMGLEGLSKWMELFGLGRITGIGIEEARGRLPISYHGPNVDFATWSAGIGQGHVAATPLQMANVAATIARDGVWMRPNVIEPRFVETLRQLPPSTTQPSWRNVPDRKDIGLSRDALDAARKGMVDVVNSPAGSGSLLMSREVKIAGKTGTAEAARFSTAVVDAEGQYVRDERGRPMRRWIRPSTAAGGLNPEAPWYLAWDEEGKNLKHSWIIGYAPADNPQIAFAVMVEYGGSGGGVAASIAHKMLDACIQHGYLSPAGPGKPAGLAVSPVSPEEPRAAR